MTLREVFRFEVAYRLRQPSTLAYAAVLLGVPFLMMHAINGSSHFLNAPQAVTNISAVLGGLSMLVSAGIFGDAAARDVQSRMYALFYTAPIRERDYVLGRFLGAVVVNAVLLLGVPLGLFLASVMPYMPAGKFGPVRLAPYAQAFVLMLLPNLVLIGACMFSAALIARRSLATYAGGVVLWFLGTVAGRLTDGLTNVTVSAMADPFGGAALNAVTRLWTPAERNARALGWPSLLVWNRLLWLAVAVLVLLVVARRFRFAQPSGVARFRWRQRREVPDRAPDRLVAVDTTPIPDAPRSFAPAARARQTLAIASRAWRDLAATRSFLVILAGSLFLVFAFGWDVGAEVFGTSTWPVAHLIAGTVLSSVLAPVVAVLIAILAGELVWRERDVGLGDIADVTPVPNVIILLGRFLALVAMLVSLQLVLALAGMLLQEVRGYPRFEPLVYLKLLFGVKLVDYVLLAVFAMAVHVILDSKYVGHLVVVLFVVGSTMAESLGVRHRMLVYASDPGWTWSDMNGLGPFLPGLVWFKLYWGAWALLLAAATSLLWVRGRERGPAQRLALARRRLAGPTLRAVAVASALIVGLGGFVFYNTNVLNDYTSAAPDARAARQAEYERRYKRYEGAAHPALAAAQLRVELYPSAGGAEIRGTLHLVNRTTQSIDSLHVLLHQEVETRRVVFDRAARAVVDDAPLRYRIYALERPLEPGDSIAMTFEVASHPRGFRNQGAATEVTQHATYLDGSWLPMLGYKAGRELGDEQERREHGLPPRVPPSSAGDVEARAGDDRVARAQVETIIGTDPRQIAITPGTLVREWREGGRRYFQYRTEVPTTFAAAILSGEYAVREAKWEGLPLRVYHHPTHDVNVDRMLRSMQASLAYFTRAFGPYQFRELRVVEFPRYASFARAHPHTIAFSEGSAFLTRVDSGDIDRTFFVVAHEAAHQWWGGQVVPARARGASMVSETLAQYSAMMVLESEYGPEMARRFSDYNMLEYLRGRTVFTNREAPLLDVDGQRYVFYFKGAVAMYTLRQQVGSDAVNGALRRFRERYTAADAPAPTSRALYAELRAVTPDSLRPLLADLFEHITLWDVRTDSARTERTSAGYRVTLHVTASKARADSVGKETAIPMDDLVEVGVFAPAAGGEGELGATLHLARHRVHEGAQTITVTVPRPPAKAGIDPFRTLIERARDDNVVSVEGHSDRREAR